MLGFGGRPVRQEHFVFEVTQRCDHRCVHCYNDCRPSGNICEELPTAETLTMLEAMLCQSRARLVTLSGGEPMLREDIFEIVDHLVERGVAINLITNGHRLDKAAIDCLGPDKISIFELPLLAADRDLHDEISGAAGAFDAATLAIANLKAAGQRVVCVFVATRLNLPGWREAAELAIALGADGIMFNRFNPGGMGKGQVERLQASPAELAEALDIAQDVTTQYGISISCSIPMVPCLFDHSRWPKLSFGYCAAGTRRAYYTLSPEGNVRPCNHSTTVLGNIREMSLRRMVRSEAMDAFASARPAFCGGCDMEDECLGGCKASAEVCCGDVAAADPFLSAYLEQSTHGSAASAE